MILSCVGNTETTLREFLAVVPSASVFSAEVWLGEWAE